MRKYRFSAEERYAVYAVHNEKCYSCTKVVDLSSMQVDHIIPESLLNKPKELDNVKSNYGLTSDFKINSFENWLPTCAPCNRRKSSMVLKFTPIIQTWLEIAQAKAKKARDLANKIINDSEVAKALNVLKRAKNAKILTPAHYKELAPLVNFHYVENGIEVANTPLILTPYMMAIPKSSDHYSNVLTKSVKLKTVGNSDGIMFMKPVNANSLLKSFIFSSEPQKSDFIVAINKPASMNTKDFTNIKNPITNPYNIEGSKKCPICGFTLQNNTTNCINCDNAKSSTMDIIF